MKKLLIILALIFSSCGVYKSTPVDKCCETDVVYLEDIKSGTTVFSTLDFNTITLDFNLGFYRSSDLYWFHNYGYWGSRPLWMDFNFYQGNLYSIHSPYYSYFNRPWNYWDWYMRPWMPSNNWNQGPYNNSGYNVVYNSGRRNSLITDNRMAIKDRIAFGKIGNSRLVTNKPVTQPKPPKPNKPVISTKPVWNNKPIRNNNKPVYNNNKPVYNNNRPINNSRPVINNNSRSTRSNTKSGRNPR